MPTQIVYINGLFWPIDKANISVLDRGFAYGDGLFETMRIYSGKVFRIEEHINRLDSTTFPTDLCVAASIACGQLGTGFCDLLIHI